MVSSQASTRMLVHNLVGATAHHLTWKDGYDREIDGHSDASFPLASSYYFSVV